jgi:manganese/iron transport system substrate-binding protein
MRKDLHVMVVRFLAALAFLAAILSGSSVWAQRSSPLNVVTTVAPLTNIALNVGGTRITLEGLIPAGVDSHTFEPSPADARKLANADLILVNGLSLEGTIVQLAESNMKPGAKLLSLGDLTITPDHRLFDFSFPEDLGDPNPHIWMNPVYGARYADLIGESLSELDPANADYYRANAARFNGRADELDRAIMAATQTIPASNRKLLTYHDSFAYFAPRYGMSVIGAIQPSDFSEPSPREVAVLIDQIRAEGVPAIFGSEVFPSRVLEQIGREAGVRYYDELRDDDLPGDDRAPEHTYLGMLKFDVQLMTEALGGDPSPLESFDPRNTYAP